MRVSLSHISSFALALFCLASCGGGGSNSSADIQQNTPLEPVIKELSIKALPAEVSLFSSGGD